MREPLEIHPYFRSAANRGMWFAAAFTLMCASLAAFSWAGLIGRGQDAPVLLLMAVAGGAMFLLMRFIIRLFAPEP